MKIIGIDPGLSGAIAVLENNNVLNIFDIPVMSEGKKNKRQLNSALLVNLLKENIIKHISPKEFYPINTEGKSLGKAIEYYTQLLVYQPVDIACIGIGENGHLAFNDPGVADFNDQKSVKVVSLDQHCRKQQYDEGWFDSIEAVPKKALTLTIPTIMSAQHISCFVPDERKANAVRNTLEGDIVETCPASVLRNHPSVNLYLDPPSAKLLKYQ